MERIQTVSIRNCAFEFLFFPPVKLCLPVFKWSLCQESVFIHTTNSPGVSTWLPVSPQPQKAPLVGARLSIVIEQSQTPACCVGDRLKERQRKHSQTTCSPRAEGLASLQAHLHTIPQFLREPAKEMKQGAGRRGEFPRRRGPVTAALLMKSMTSEESNERINAAGENSYPLQPDAGFTCQGLLG